MSKFPYQKSGPVLWIGRVALVTLAAGLGQASGAQLRGAAQLNEAFDNISSLPGNGWAMINNSAPLGLTDWFQGDSLEFGAHQGPPTAYIAADFLNAGDGAGFDTISNWLLTPEITLADGVELSFYTRTINNNPWPERLQVRMSLSGSSTDVGSSAASIGDFTELMLQINPALAVGVYPESWTRYTVTLSGIGAPTSGRLAFRYYVTDAGPSGNNSYYIGIDTVDVSAPPGPGFDDCNDNLVPDDAEDCDSNGVPDACDLDCQAAACATCFFGGLEACAGDYAGTYSGGSAGTATGTLAADGDFTVLFVSVFGPILLNGVVNVAPGGQVSGDVSGVVVAGQFDFGDCSAAGTWTASSGPSGSWTISRSALGPCRDDCNSNGLLDECELADGSSDDCNTNGLPDECDIAAGTSQDCQTDGVPDECNFVDCNTNGTLDECDIAGGASFDTNSDGVPDECQACGNDAECDDGLHCTGTETCVGALCQPGVDPCAALGLVCDEANDACNCDDDADCNDGIACTNDTCQADGSCLSTPINANCTDDGLYCTGPESCDATLGCVSAGNPCTASGLGCDETTDTCRSCLTDAECDDGAFCNGTETCVDGECVAGQACDKTFCDEATKTCQNCVSDSNCDDGVYCNGPETCVDGSCVTGAAPCPGQACDKTEQVCFDSECDSNGDCADADICTTDTCEDDRCINAAIGGCTDDDNDRVPDDRDDCLGTPADAAVDARGCACEQLDDDEDDVDNCIDECRNTPADSPADARGCSCEQRDEDNDKVDDCDDRCAGTAADDLVDEAGCAERQLDADSDGVFNPDDICPTTPTGEEADTAGCSFGQRDDDKDGIINARDTCADTIEGHAVDDAGCAHSQIDSDGDAVFDAFDLCLFTTPGAAVDAQGCSAVQRGLDELSAGATVPGSDADATSSSDTGSSSAGRSGGLCGGLGMLPLAALFLTLTAARRRRR
ncbi:MAG: hypothetical protein GY778_11415 [bacterium]|nr:hypothetical protein [bacterium]